MMVSLLKRFNGILLFELAVFLTVSGLHYHHQRPPPPRPPPRAPPRPPPHRLPPPPIPPRPTTITSTATTTPAPEVEVELEETVKPLNTTTAPPSTLKPVSPKGNFYYKEYPFYDYYSSYYNYHNRQPYDQNQYYSQAQGYYNNGYHFGQSSVAGQGQKLPAHVTPGPYPTQYPYQYHPPPNGPYAVTQRPPPAFNHAQHPNPEVHGPPPNNSPYNHYSATPIPPTPYLPPARDPYQLPPPKHQGMNANQQSPAIDPFLQQPQPVAPGQQPSPAQRNYYEQQGQYQQPYNEPAYSASTQQRPNRLPPTLPGNMQTQQERSHQRQRLQKHPTNRRQMVDSQGYAGDPILPAPSSPLSENRIRQPNQRRISAENPTAVRYKEPVRDSFSSRSGNLMIQTLDGIQPQAPTAESQYFQADQILKSSRTNEYGIETPVRTKTVFIKQASNNIEKPPGDIAYLKPKVTVKAEYNIPKNSEKKQRIPTENQLLEIKKQQLELLKMLHKVQIERKKTPKRENPYLKAIYESPPVKLSANVKKDQPKQCPLYKYDVLDNKIEIHTEPGRCKIVIMLPADGKRPKLSYLARN